MSSSKAKIALDKTLYQTLLESNSKKTSLDFVFNETFCKVYETTREQYINKLKEDLELILA